MDKHSCIYAALVVIIFPFLVVLLLKQGFSADVTTDETEGHESFLEGDSIITVRVMLEDGIVVMELEDYLVGVVLGELPAYFHSEAFMAQAVAARTLTLRAVTQSSKHAQADVCTNPSCCQAYYPPEEYERVNPAAVAKATQAVRETTAEVIFYQQELIEALYFSCSGGRTEDAVAVWGADVPYLQAVDSPGEEAAEHFTDTVVLSVSEFCQKLSLKKALPQIKGYEYSDGGGVQRVAINGKSFSGTELRRCLGLRSTSFRISVMNDIVTITTYGFGHRVGMSQYGSNAMACLGIGYKEILKHYYSGVEIGTYKP